MCFNNKLTRRDSDPRIQQTFWFEADKGAVPSNADPSLEDEKLIIDYCIPSSRSKTIQNIGLFNKVLKILISLESMILQLI